LGKIGFSGEGVINPLRIFPQKNFRPPNSSKKRDILKKGAPTFFRGGDSPGETLQVWRGEKYLGVRMRLHERGPLSKNFWARGPPKEEFSPQKGFLAKK